MQQVLTFLAPPKSRKAELLRDMIEGKFIAEQDYNYNRFRGDISDLKNKHHVPLRFAEEPFKSKYGHNRNYHKHYILTIDREKCIEIYERLNK